MVRGMHVVVKVGTGGIEGASLMGEADLNGSGGVERHSLSSSSINRSWR